MPKAPEIWRVYRDGELKINGHASRHCVVSVSSYGRVMVNDVLVPLNPGPKYLRACFLGTGMYVHQMVAEAFIGPKPLGLEVRHLDGNRLNNHSCNLAYGTRRQNMLDAMKHGTHINLKSKGETNPSAKLTEAEVMQIRELQRNTNLTYKEIAMRFKVNGDTVQSIVNGRLWKHLPILKRQKTTSHWYGNQYRRVG